MEHSLSITEDVFEELVFALRVSLARVSVDELSAPTARAHWKKLNDWLDAAERLQSQNASTRDLRSLRDFPLSGAELRALQLAVDRAACFPQRAARAARASARSGAAHAVSPHEAPKEAKQAERRHQKIIQSPPVTPQVRLHRGLWRIHLSSLAVVVTIGVVCLLNVLALVAPHILSPADLVGINVGALALALLLWFVYYWRFRQHQRLIYQIN